MSLGIARPISPVLPARPAAVPDPRVAGEDPARIRATIARSPLFAALPITAIEDLTARVTVRKVAVGSAVVAQDEPGDAMFVIMSGRVKVVMFGESGRKVTLSLLRSGDSFGEMSDSGSGSGTGFTCPENFELVTAICDLSFNPDTCVLTYNEVRFCLPTDWVRQRCSGELTPQPSNPGSWIFNPST